MTRSRQKTEEPAPGAYSVIFTEAGEVTVRGPGVERRTDVRMAVDDRGISLAFGTLLPPHLADLLDIAVAAYVADRLCVRRTRTAARSQADELWQRHMTIRLPLRDRDAWSPDLCGRVEALLAFLTDDVWHLEFTKERAKLRVSETQGSLFSDIPTGDVTSALLSGGLDSLVGLTTELVRHPERTVVAFSARTNRRIGKYQRLQVQALRSHFGTRLRHIPVAITLTDRRQGAYDREEPSQRTRGFVFQVFGAVTAAVAEIHNLHVYENGVGALNLPYSAAQLGTQATRATNPLTIDLASDLLSDVTGHPFRVSLPHRFDTKAEMCSILHDPRFRELIPLTISCDNFPQRFASRPQCGACPSCVFSRQSLFSAGLRDADPSGRFRHDVYALDASSTDRSYHLRVMTSQAGMLSSLVDETAPWMALVRRFPILYDIAHSHVRRNQVDPSSDIVALLKRYSNEWLAFWHAVNRPSPASA